MQATGGKNYAAESVRSGTAHSGIGDNSRDGDGTRSKARHRADRVRTAVWRSHSAPK